MAMTKSAGDVRWLVMLCEFGAVCIHGCSQNNPKPGQYLRQPEVLPGAISRKIATPADGLVTRASGDATLAHAASSFFGVDALREVFSLAGRDCSVDIRRA